MIQYSPVKCDNCHSEFDIITLDGKILGKFFCPKCGTPYHRQGNEDE